MAGDQGSRPSYIHTRRIVRMSTLLKIEFTISEDKSDEAGVFISSKVPHGWEETPVDGGRHFSLYLEDHPLQY